MLGEEEAAALGWVPAPPVAQEARPRQLNRGRRPLGALHGRATSTRGRGKRPERHSSRLIRQNGRVSLQMDNVGGHAPGCRNAANETRGPQGADPPGGRRGEHQVYGLVRETRPAEVAGARASGRYSIEEMK